jgi:clan AA aspartic protease (TIGR02281 family)
MRGSVEFHSAMTFPRCAIVCGWFLALASPLPADTITLKNGRTIEGIITKETDTHVYLDLGVGSTTLARTAIGAVTRSSDEDNLKIRAGWKKTYFLHKNQVPPGLENLAAEFTRLTEQRDAAIGARQALARAGTDEAALGNELEQIQKRIVETSRKIQRAAPEKDIAEYNAMVLTNNALNARLTVKRDELDKLRKSRQPALGQIAAYLDALPAFERSLAEPMKTLKEGKEDDDRRYFFDRISESLKTFDGEFSTATIDVTRSHSGTIVTALVNDAVQGKFLLDTGAGMVMLSDAFARRLKLDPAHLPTAEFVMADGRKVTGRAVLLDSMKLGEARAEGVEAAILPTAPGEDLDGLLGMSFLKHFAVDLQGPSGTLTLRQFTPK